MVRRLVVASLLLAGCANLPTTPTTTSRYVCVLPSPSDDEEEEAEDEPSPACTYEEVATVVEETTIVTEIYDEPPPSPTPRPSPTPTPTQSPTPTPESDIHKNTRLAVQLFEGVNHERQWNGKPALVSSAELDAKAMNHSRWMAEHLVSSDFEGRVAPGERLAYGEGENVGRTRGDDKWSLLHQWELEPTAGLNLYDERMSRLGVGVWHDVLGRTYWTMIVGR